MVPYKKLTDLLDETIRAYRKPGHVCGKPGPAKTEESDLQEILSKTDDLHWNMDSMFCYMVPLKDTEECIKAAKEMLPDNEFIMQTGKFYYPPGSHMGWHTNSNSEGIRVYITRCKEGNKSYFRYMLDGQIYTEWEKEGWNARQFVVSKEKPFWHCVKSDTERYSFGFRFKS